MLTLHEPRGPRPPGGSPDEAGREDAADAAAPVAAAAIVCAACGHPITTARHRTTRQGSHVHRFMNPGGFLYEIGCFDDALGCSIAGPESHEYPWFPGFGWRIALCGGCRDQLGWHFRDGAGAGFFGLILERLREGDAP